MKKNMLTLALLLPALGCQSAASIRPKATIQECDNSGYARDQTQFVSTLTTDYFQRGRATDSRELSEQFDGVRDTS